MNLTGTKRLETERLILRQIKEDDIDRYFAEILSDKERIDYLDWDCAADIGAAKGIVENIISRYRQKDFFFWVIQAKNTPEVIGYVWICRTENERRLAEIEYVLCRGAEGCGYMTEAVRRVLTYLLSEVGYYRVEAVCNVENTASTKVMKASGMVFEGILRGRAKRKKADGNPGDLKIFAALPADLKSPKPLL